MFPIAVHDHWRRATLRYVAVGESELVRSAQAGDVDAFSALVEQWWARLVALARSITGELEAEDAVQEALLAAWRRLGQLRSAEAFGSWILRIVARRCLRHARAGSRLVALAAVAEPADPAAAVRRAEVDVERLLALLAPRQRAVMHLTVVEGMSDREIGCILHIDPASVRSHRRRARQRLRAVLRPDGEGG